MTRLLAFDIGNTHIKMGIFEGETLRASFRLTTSVRRSTDEYGSDLLGLLRTEGLEPSDIDRVAIASVVPDLMHSFVSAIRRYFDKEPLLIGPGVKSGVKLRVANPREVGADLICDTAAALHAYGAPCLVVDFGTATKYEVINSEGELMAAVFSPGIGISADALCERAAQLPRIEIQKPRSILTSDTTECMQAGIVYGYIGQVNYIVDLIKQEMGLPHMRVVATGGFGRVLAQEISAIDLYDRNLTLTGVRLIAEKNRSPRLKAAE